MINEVIKERMEVVGMTQAKLAELTGSTPAQLSLFFKGEASLSRKALDKCFECLGIPLQTIGNRMQMAKKVAAALEKKSVAEVVAMNKAEMIKESGYNEIMALPDVTKEEFELMLSSQIADCESTYPYFKTLVLHYKELSGKMTPKSVENSFNALAKYLVPLAAIPLIGPISVIGLAVMAMVSKKSSISNSLSNAWGPLLTLTLSLFDKEKKVK